MAIRTTEELVKDVLADNYDAKKRPNLAAKMAIASRVTDDVSTGATNKGYSLSAAKLRDIETYLTAYLYTVGDPLPTSESAGSGSASYGERSYLDVAKMLDPSGTLAGLLSPKRASIGWLGKIPSEQVPFWQRD